MDVIIDRDGKVTQDVAFSNVYTRIDKNYAYEEPKLLANRHYMKLLNLTRQMRSGVKDSHDVVEYWMLYMNMRAGERLASFKTGIFRTVELFKYHGSGKYVAYSDNLYHDTLSVSAYAHVTSPIRRIVDLLNQSILMYELGLAKRNDNTTRFIEQWMNKVDYINKTSKAIRRVQSDCEIVTYCSNNHNFADREYNGILFDGVRDGDMFKYTVYLEELKVFSKCKTTSELPEHSNAKFKIYYFGDEYDAKRKIRVQLLLHEELIRYQNSCKTNKVN